jgi:glycosyltransferase involved in cell wall biosynthesis
VRIAVFENLANSAYIVTKALRRRGVPADLVLDPVDRHAMSDPRWEDLDIEMPTDRLDGASLPPSELPEWIRFQPSTLTGRQRTPTGRAERMARSLGAAPGVARELRAAAGVAGRRGAQMVLQRAWVIRTLSRYDCVIAYGMGAAWTAFARVPYLATTWGGDITMVPFYDTGDWEGHDALDLPGPADDLSAQAKLQRLGYRCAGRILLTDPRFIPYASRLGHSAKSVELGFFIDTERYAPGPEPELRAELLGGREGPIVFMPSRQDWFWKGSDRLLRGFAAAGHPDAVLVCAGWGADLERSQELIGELGIGDRVRLLPYAMSKGRLRRFYRAADVVADQFTVGSYGGSALEAMSCARPVLIHLEPERFAGRPDALPPVANVAEPDAIAQRLRELLGSGDARARLGARAREWMIANHGPSLIDRTLDLCHAVVEGR